MLYRLTSIPYTEGKLISLYFLFSNFVFLVLSIFFFFESSYKTLHKVCIKVVLIFVGVLPVFRSLRFSFLVFRLFSACFPFFYPLAL